MDIEEELKQKLNEANEALNRLKILYDIADKEQKAITIENNNGMYNPNSFLVREFTGDKKLYERNS